MDGVEVLVACCTDRELAMSEVDDDQMNPSDHIARLHEESEP